MTDANNQINEVLSKLTALGTILIPMNLITGKWYLTSFTPSGRLKSDCLNKGIWGMNVHVPGQEVPGYAWFASIVGALITLGVVGGFSTYKLMVR
jgi:magnesium transporter